MDDDETTSRWDGYNVQTVAWAIVAAVGIIGLTVLITAAVIGNTQLTRQVNDLDQKAYVVCLQAGHSPTECRAGEYGIR